MLLLFGDIFVGPSLQSEAETLLLLQNQICSALLFIRRPKKEIYLTSIVILAAVLATLYQYWFDHQRPYLFALIFFSYFLLIGYRLFSEVISQERVDIQTVATVFCGFMLIALIASLVFITMENSTPSFKGIDQNSFSSFMYFSFITLLTIGYGDITPVTEAAQRLVVLFGLIGHFYSLFVIAIIVGKYLKEARE
jgi:hypothetical protein